MLIVLPAIALVAAWVLLYFRVEPVSTWFYVFAWYPTLLLLERIVRHGGAGARPFQRPGQLVSLFGWSAIVWLLYEAANFRLDNWYYVFLPHAKVERWAGVLLSFATVLPALFLAERVLEGVGVRPTGGDDP